MDKIVDSHCHLDFKDFKDDLENVLQRAKKKNVNYFLTISIDLENFDEIKKITNKYSNIWCSTGIHPNNVPKKINNDKISKVFDKIKENLKFKKAVGLGETGLDFFRENENKKNQLIFFDNHLYLSGEKKIPTIIHSRNADKDTMEMILKGYKNYEASGLIHCFTSGKSLARVALDNGFYISISGIVTYKQSYSLRDIVKYIPLDRLLVETDSPFLAPVPKRGKRNEPSFLEHTLQEISKIKKKSIQEVTRITTQNFFHLFNKIKI